MNGVAAVAPDDRADQRVPRDKSGAQAPKIVLAPCRQYPSSDTPACGSNLGFSPPLVDVLFIHILLF